MQWRISRLAARFSLAGTLSLATVLPVGSLQAQEGTVAPKRGLAPSQTAADTPETRFGEVPVPVSGLQEWVWGGREAAKTWGMNQIAVIQAASGDVQGAKRTLSQIDENGPPGPSEVTVVSFIDGQPIYESSTTGCANFIPTQNGDWLRAEHSQVPQKHLTARCLSPFLTPMPLRTPGWGGRDARGTQYFVARDRAADRVSATLPSDLPADYLAADPHHGAVVDFTDECDAKGVRVTSRRYADGYAVIETPRVSGR